MKCLDKVDSKIFPFNWANLDYYPASTGKYNEIYLPTDAKLSEFILLFYSLFSSVKSDVKIYNNSWWDYCIDIWNPETDEYDYTLVGKSLETKEYFILLIESSIEIGYAGSCICLNWDKFLHIALQCLINHKAPYSPIFYNEANNFFSIFTIQVALDFTIKMKIN
jgi:hypothetical protein